MIGALIIRLLIPRMHKRIRGINNPTPYLTEPCLTIPCRAIPCHAPPDRTRPNRASKSFCPQMWRRELNPIKPIVATCPQLTVPYLTKPRRASPDLAPPDYTLPCQTVTRQTKPCYKPFGKTWRRESNPPEAPSAMCPYRTVPNRASPDLIPPHNTMPKTA